MTDVHRWFRVGRGFVIDPVRFNGGWLDTPIFDRASLGRGATLAGPAIVEQPDTTVVIDPGATAIVDDLGNLVISVGAA
jgi:N-methylhydantoinase A